ncbi:MAG TPA: NfeD family protein, partial [Sphingomonas sp.]
MSLDDLGLTPAGAWLAVALLLGGAELLAPGVFLLFAALASAVTAAILLAVPDLPLVGQLVSFA